MLPEQKNPCDFLYLYTQVPSLDVTVYKVSVDTVLAGKTYVSESFAYTLDEDDVAELVASTGSVLASEDTSGDYNYESTSLYQTS